MLASSFRMQGCKLNVWWNRIEQLTCRLVRVIGWDDSLFDKIIDLTVPSPKQSALSYLKHQIWS